MEDTRIYITDICNDILDNYFPQIDSLGELFTPDSKRATRIIVNKITRIIDEFETYCPLIGQIQINIGNDGYYTFVDNYKDVVEGRVAKEDTELVPVTVAKVSGTTFAYTGRLASTANYWTYNRPTYKGYGRNCSQVLYCTFHYPIYVEYTEDGYLNKFSHIFGLDKENKSMLFNLMELRFLEAIKGNEGRIKLPTTVEFFNLDNDIQALEKMVEDDRVSSSSARIAWR